MTEKKSLGRVGLIVLAMFFSGFIAEAQAQKEAAPLSEKARKVRVMFQNRCHVCHDVDSERVKPLGPSLNGLFQRDELVTGKPVTKENIKEIIKMGPTPGMPAFRYTLSDQEIDDLIEYLVER